MSYRQLDVKVWIRNLVRQHHMERRCTESDMVELECTPRVSDVCAR